MSAIRRLLLGWACVLSVCTVAFAKEKPWVEVRSPHFRVLSDGSAGDARRVAREFEQMRTVFALNFPTLRLETGAPLLVYAPRDDSSMKALAPTLWKQKGAKPAGYFQHGWDKQFAVVQLDRIGPGAYLVVYHEYVHTLLHANFRWLPVWLDEGLAEFYGNTRFEQSRIFVGAPSFRLGVVQSKPLIPIETLIAVDRRSPYYHDYDKVDMFYAESWALTHFLTFGPGMEKGRRLTEFYTQLQQGVEQKKAFEQAFGNFKQVREALDQYVRKFQMAAWVMSTPPQIDERSFGIRTLSLAETEAELGSLHLWSRETEVARALIEQALKNDPNLALAHEDMGFLDFADGKDEDAAREFSRSYQLDSSRYLSLFFKTMLSPAAHSDGTGDQTSFRDALLHTLHINAQFAPAYVQLALLDIRQNNFIDALAVSRRAEQLEPSRAGYHVLTGRILLGMGHGAEASTVAKYVADRWYGPDHDEAVELWNNVPATQRNAGESPSESVPPDTETVEGRIQSTACDEKHPGFILVLNHDGQLLSFHSNAGVEAGFSDILWYGADHFSLCHHVEGLRAIVRYKPASNKSFAGDLAELELREDLPARPPVSKAESVPAAEKR